VDFIGQKQREDIAINWIIIYLRGYEGKAKPVWETIVDRCPEFKFWWNRWELLKVLNGVLFYKWVGEADTFRWKIAIPRSLVSFVLWCVHDAPGAGHQGQQRTYKLLEQSVYIWKSQRADVKEYVMHCGICEEKKSPSRIKRHTMKTYITGARFERVATDIAVDFPKTEEGYEHILAIQDYFTKYLVLVPIKDMEATTVADAVTLHWITRFGSPMELYSDQGANFESKLMKQVLALFGIRKTKTTPVHPRSDGMVERQMNTSKTMLS
jgi:hypothetical protein